VQITLSWENRRSLNLNQALQLKPGDVVAFVGGGGKTTAMFRLAAEIVESGGRVLTTTTTRIFAAQTRLAPIHIQTVTDLATAFESSPHVLLTGPVNKAEGKAFGVDPSLISSLQSQITNCQLPITNILVEADGSRMRPFKAPAEHEPVIPDCATLVVPVVGVDVVGKPLSPEFVHRPELVARLHAGEVVSIGMVAGVLAHPLGGRKNVPLTARFVPLINKVETESESILAEQIAERLLNEGGVEAVLAGAVARSHSPVSRVWKRR
jgi:molybdenum cofactor cytidylyltransferase